MSGIQPKITRHVKKQENDPELTSARISRQTSQEIEKLCPVDMEDTHAPKTP